MLREMCEEFEEIQSEKTNTKYRLPDREQLYDTYLKISADKIITVVEHAIKLANQELKKVLLAKDEKVKAILNTLTS